MIRAITDALVRAAARRWPDPEAMEREWQAELAHLRAGRHTGVRQLTFAASLAGTPRAAPEFALPFLGYAATAVLACSLAFSAPKPVQDLLGHLGWDGDTIWTTARAIAFAASVAMMILVGRRLARRGPGGTVGMLVQFAAVAYLGRRAVDDLFSPPDTGPDLAAVAVWLVLTAATLAAAGGLARRGRRGWAWVAGIAGSLVAADVSTAVMVSRIAARAGFGLIDAPVWFAYTLVPDLPNYGGTMPTSLLYPTDYVQAVPAGPSIGGVADPLVMPLLLCAMAALATMMAAGRAAARRPVPVAAPEVALGPYRRPAVLAALVALAAGVGSWAWLVWLRPPTPDEMPTGVQVYDWDQLTYLRFAAVVTTVLALAALLALRRRGPVAMPALAAFALCAAAEMGLDRLGGHGLRAAAVVCVVAAGAATGATALSARLRTPPGDPRTALTFVAVTATVAAPTGLFVFPQLPWAIIATTYIGAAALWTLATGSALAARTAPIRPAFAVALFAGGLAVVLASVPFENLHRLYYPDPTFFVQAPLAVLLLAVVRAPGRRWRWFAAGLGAAAAAAAVMRSLDVPTAIPTWLVAEGAGHPWYPFRGGGSGLGVVVLGVGVAALVCRRRPADVGL